jgi:hypothetical protein
MSIVLPDATLDKIGRMLLKLRPDTCLIKRKPSGRGIGGAPAGGDYSTVGSVSCRVAVPQRAAQEGIYGGRFVPEADYIVALPRGTDVNSQDRISVNGQTLEVISVPSAASYFVEIVLPCKAAT